MGVVGRVWVCIGVGGALVLSLFLMSSSASAQSALLDALSTRVTLAHPDSVASLVAVEQIIRSGDTVATDQTGRAVVTYRDGSTALLEENSSLTIEFVQTSAGDYVVRMRQTLGRVWYAVTRAVTLGSRYEVRSAGTASVIRAGSDSYVTVSPTGETTVVTISGTVDTTANGVAVSVPAGYSTTVSAAGAASPQNIPAPSTPTPTAPTNAFVPPVSTLPPAPSSALTKSKTPSPTLPIATPRPTAAPAPASTPQLKDKFGPRKDAPGQPPPKTAPL
ncbi:MAG: hypothetical protein AUI15_34205 [Actinobacteria bacterium 13_2_20CM_2_66_6]|nr:MAG: hypothetical protein AUI15_34205 [Actinobacteria bacterium 13_2_20CM_2_66_6]